MSHSQQNVRVRLLAAQDRFDVRLQDRRLAAAFLGMPRHLARRPEPRHVFDNVARDESPLPPKGKDARDVARCVMRAAIDTGDARVIHDTHLEIARFFDELKGQALIDCPASELPTLNHAMVAAARRASHLLGDIAEAGTLRSETAIEQALRDADETIVSIEVFREAAGHAIRSSPPRSIAR